MGISTRLVVPVFLCLSAAAYAQDFGTEWIDRVTHQIEQDRGPLSPKDADLQIFLGERVYYDNNVFLEEDSDKAEGDTVFVTYGNVRLTYAETHFDAALDLLANYNHYVHEEDASDDEQRLYGRARYVDTSFQLELAQILRRLSVPLNSDTFGLIPNFPERQEMLISDTVPRIQINFTDIAYLELNGQFQLVQMDDDEFEEINNVNYRAGATLGYALPSGADILVNGGYLAIDYDQATDELVNPGPPDVTGYYIRGGWRGELQQRISLSVLAGVTGLRTEKETDATGATIPRQEHTTADVEMHMRFETTEKLTLFVDFSRRGAFGFAQSFQIVSRVTAGLEYQAHEMVTFRARGEYNYSHGIDGLNREYFSLHGGLVYKPLWLSQNVLFDAGVTWRRGEVKDGGSGEYDNFIGSVGLAIVF